MAGRRAGPFGPAVAISFAPMKHNLAAVTATACLVAASFVSAQSGIQPTGIQQGAAQTNQNKWNAKGPWAATERSGPLEAQQKNPFKVFDNVYYVGLQTVAA